METSSVNEFPNSFSKTIVAQLKSATDIETSSEKHIYANSEIPYHESTEQKLALNDNLLTGKYFHIIKKSCTTKMMNPKLHHKYNYRPEALATDEYGSPNLWYLLLRVNGCEDISEFHDMDYVLLPSIDVIERCLLNSEFIGKKEVV